MGLAWAQFVLMRTADWSHCSVISPNMGVFTGRNRTETVSSLSVTSQGKYCRLKRTCTSHSDRPIRWRQGWQRGTVFGFHWNHWGLLTIFTKEHPTTSTSSLTTHLWVSIIKPPGSRSGPKRAEPDYLGTGGLPDHNPPPQTVWVNLWRAHLLSR